MGSSGEMNGHHRLAFLRKEWGSGNTNCCFFFEPQLLTQPGNDSRWKDSALAAQYTYTDFYKLRLVAVAVSFPTIFFGL